MPNNATVVASASAAIAQATTTFTIFMPSISDVRKADPQADPSTKGDVHLALVASSIVSLAVGWMLSGLSNSRIPLIATVIICVMFVALYEMALQGRNLFE